MMFDYPVREQSSQLWQRKIDENFILEYLMVDNTSTFLNVKLNGKFNVYPNTTDYLQLYVA